ncbi:response regulator [Pedobacter sp.]|jgi:DNA-binding response OmpR family regulator|uniref:response regulator n=1 Tax=Pedobacter sp. TaxID=1411316 RepID=UPI002C66F5B3|nr:response regulator [Pedobacter sp.]HWW39607.1 response regulator [Pedobacter sp.]
MNTQKKVMIADDDPGILDAVEAMLEFGGYEVSSTSNGATVLEMHDHLPDLLLLDIWMSGTDGRDVCKVLKKQEDTKNIPIIMISASTELERSAKEAGADDFLEKPFDMEVLLGKIAHFLK